MITYNNPKDTERRSNVVPLNLEETETLIRHLNSILPQYGAIISDNLQRLLDHHANLQHFYDNAGGWERMTKIQKENEELKGKIAELILAYGTIEAKPLNISTNDKWISVDERLPGEENSDVLVVIDGKTKIANYIWDKDCFARHGSMIDNVTHWQPLPAPPKSK